MKSPELNHEKGPVVFNRLEFLKQYPNRLRGFRLVTKEDIKPNAKLFMIDIITDKGIPKESSGDPQPIQLAKEPFRQMWVSMGDDEPLGPGVCIIGRGGEENVVSLNYFLDEVCEINPYTQRVEIYLTRT